MLPVLKAARRPLSPKWEPFGLDREGWNDLDRLVNKLVHHRHFEHLKRKDIRIALHDAAVRYRRTPVGERPPTKLFAAASLDDMARPPMRRTVYLGVKHLKLPHGTHIADALFLDPTQQPELQEAFDRFGDAAPPLLCAFDVVAGTDALLLERARDRAEVALSLIRQQNLFGFPAKIYLDQVIFGLDGTWTWNNDDTTARAGWWRHEPTPIPMDLSHPNGSEWRARLTELSDLYQALPPSLRVRLNTCLEWLDVAALSDRWRIIIPAIFSAMEALLVPETIGLKAEVVTVRSVAAHVACDHGFFDPGEILEAYALRNDLIHGAPTDDVISAAALEFAETRRLWAFRVLSDYLAFANAIGAKDVGTIVSTLDSDACVKVCNWLDEHGGGRVVEEYRKVIRAALPAPMPSISPASSDDADDISQSVESDSK
jgi:hypothetical protein